MPYPETAEGFMIKDHKNWTDFEKQEFPLKKFEDRDIDIAIDACGVCGSDVHTINGGWGDAPLPLTVGHEIIGRAIRVGKGVTTVKVGDRVGVGAQIGSDLTCNNCKTDQENYCPNMIDTFGGYWADGTKTQGGYASHIRSHEYFTFKIPDNIETSIAAPMLCAGITVYSPLVRLGCGPGKKIAIVGLGGLGHFAVMFANALGAEVSVISHSPNKKEDALKLGAKEFIVSNEKDWNKPYAFTFDFIINSADSAHKFDMNAYMSTMKVGGTFHQVGVPDAPFPQLSMGNFMGGQYAIAASHIGNRPEMIAMLKLVSEKNIKSWVETIDISEKGCAEAVTRVHKNDVRYRFTLVNYDKVFGKRGENVANGTKEEIAHASSKVDKTGQGTIDPETGLKVYWEVGV